MSLLDQELSAVGSRFRQLEWWRGVSVVCILLAVTGVALLIMQLTAQWMHPYSGWILLIGGLLCLAVVGLTTWRKYHDQRWVAHQIEDRFPELDQRLITTLDEVERNHGRPLGYLQHTVFQEAITHSYHNPWTNVVPSRLLQAFRSRGLVAFCLMAATSIGLMKLQPPATAFVAKESTKKVDDVLEQISNFDIQVEPGNTEIEKGTSLIAVARFGKKVPKLAELVARTGSEELRVPMSRSLDDPLFGGTISDVQQPLEYHVAYDGDKSEVYRVTVFTYPELVRADAVLEYPSYTNMADKRVEDTRRVSVVEGTRVTWEMHLNKPGVEAELVPTDEGDPIPLKVDSTDPLNQLVSLEMKESRTWKLVLRDVDGRENRNPPTITAKVTPNRPPNLKLELARDASVSPLEEFLVKASVSDDYGLKQYGLNYTLASASPKDVVLGQETTQREKKVAEHQLDFEALEAEPDQLLSYYFWAEDTDAAGSPRRTLSDMFFAEVRHFEEIFRQGEQQPGGQQQQQQQQQQSQNAHDAEQLAELQKQIINATWKLIRRETAAEVSSKFKDDISVIVESQQAASEQLQQLGENLQDAESKQHLQDVRRHMLESLQKLMTSYSDSTAEPLTPAMQAQRAAYQGLLKLRAREHEVQQSQQQQGQPGQQSASRQRFQQQLQQLELQNDQNRYETEQQAQQEEDAAQTELRQALSRLRELAQRQEDLNKQLQELQNALEQAETEEEREEIQRQLKRLRDQQQEMLRDTDELMERLDESQNQEELQQTQEQLEQTREQMRESAEELERGEVTPALASGTRAQRELEEMREELRRQSANQFSEQMRDMRDRARELESRQEEIGQQLENQNQTREDGAGLRSEEPVEEEKLGDALREQNEKLNELLQEIEETVREADESEPLLAEDLYDTFREIGQQRTTDKLEAAARYSDRGLNEQAKDLETEARESISNFREQIEGAAERVLGDETAALRTAMQMLQDLERQLDSEISQNDESYQQERDRQERDPQDRQPREGQPGEQPGQQPGQGERSDQEQQGSPRDGQDGQQPSEQGNQQAGQSPGQGQPSDQQQEQPSENQQGSPSEQQNQEGQQPGQQPGDGGGSEQPPNQDRQNQRGGPQQMRDTLRGGGDRRQDGGGGLGNWERLDVAPITGDDFREWSDRLRDVEEIVDDPELRAEAARIRERARSFRQDFKRHSEEPKWTLIKEMVARPLRELRQEVSAELLRRSATKNALVPIDRDPVPEQFTEQVRRYYENLGSGE